MSGAISVLLVCGLVGVLLFVGWLVNSVVESVDE